MWFDGLGTGARTMGERVDLRVLARVTVNAAEARKGVLAVNVHGARTADALAAGAAERQRRIHFILNFNQCVEDLHLAEYKKIKRVRENAPWDRTG